MVPFRPDGTAANIELVPPKTRAIDLRVGDLFVFQGRQETVAGIRAYRDSVTDEAPAAHGEGYVYKISDCGRSGSSDPDDGAGRQEVILRVAMW